MNREPTQSPLSNDSPSQDLAGIEKPMLTFVGDDFTGSTDAMESLSIAGIRTRLYLKAPQIQTSSTADSASTGRGEIASRNPSAIGVATICRSLSPAKMTDVLTETFLRLKSFGAQFNQYKVCSTFDSSPTIGSIGRATEIGRSVFNTDVVPMIVGAPHLGRYCLFGNLFAAMGNDQEIYRLDRHPVMSSHPVTPTLESDLRRQLASQTDLSVYNFDILKVSQGEAKSGAELQQVLTSKRPAVVLFDILCESQLSILGRLLSELHSHHVKKSVENRGMFAVGSSGLTAALTAHWTALNLIAPTSFAMAQPACPMLVASGSCSPITAGQIERAIRDGFGEVSLDTNAICRGPDFADREIARAAACAIADIKMNRHTIIHTARGVDDPRVAAHQYAVDPSAHITPSQLLGTALGRICRMVLNEMIALPIRRLLICGGDTSGYLATTLGIESLEMIAPLARGAPLCVARSSDPATDGLQMNFKGGQVGAPDYFQCVANGQL